ncbi:hypothetical protein QA612_17400 [Evansella sp. AB-P1]|uniref:hypothetical protein n=1 Tax=Evansella sp. AB-P1 TaxID=3037653 RepID=UPI00241F6328|nr:hypothetical protein [Evansella sp. AB-P1]MDG5789238.1 hypothetical protein [Evansella sp. AB-P1]
MPKYIKPIIFITLFAISITYFITLRHDMTPVGEGLISTFILFIILWPLNLLITWSFTRGSNPTWQQTITRTTYQTIGIFIGVALIHAITSIFIDVPHLI